MAQILTFLGKGGTGRTTIAIATAKALAQQGKRVLLLGQTPEPSLSLLLNTPIPRTSAAPQAIAPNLEIWHLSAARLLEQSWEEVKKLEAQYVRTPFFKNVYGQELAVLPGMDNALVLNALREYDASGTYDVIVLDSRGDLQTLRMLGMAETLGWYVRRFRQVFADSDLGKALAPFIQPITSTVLNVNWSADSQPQPVQKMNNLLDEGLAAIADPNRVAAYLVTTADPLAIATARYLWGSSQQVGLTVAGVIANQATNASFSDQFSPLEISTLPAMADPSDWQGLINALPDFSQVSRSPRPIAIDIPSRQIKLFLPGFNKEDVKLSQYGPEVTIEAGDQRRNITLPPELSGQSVTGAKFQDGYLIVSF
uniref:Anion-transporting ATPase n=1 Tax=Cyanothece sp. (strain PCC 7425 / ATCC 29141) TaxID=395961 RepID=B8HKD6_CYAP4